MENYNTGKPLDMKNITDFKKAIKEFAEGNLELEKLLLNCYKNKIETIACCKGHDDGKRKPYVSFTYTPQNKKFINALLNGIQNSPYNFRYFKVYEKQSFINIEAIDPKDANQFFHLLNDIVTEFDRERNYEEELSEENKNYISILNDMEKDYSFIPGDMLQFGTIKEKEHTNYTLITTNPLYQSLAEKSGFQHFTENQIPYYNSNDNNSENLKKMAETLHQKNMSEISLPPDNEIEIEFQYDERTRENPSINRLKVNLGESIYLVQRKLEICREKGINAFAIFNGIEYNNFTNELSEHSTPPTK